MSRTTPMQPTMGIPEPLPETKFLALKEKLTRFMHSDIYPNERLFLQQSRAIGHLSNEWTHAPILMELKRKAKAMGLWNLFLPVDSAAVAGTSLGGGLTNRQYGEVCEIFGTCIPMEFAAQGKFNLFLVLNTAAIYLLTRTNYSFSHLFF